MFRLNRRKFLGYLGGSAGVLGMGISQEALGQTGGSKAKPISGNTIETDLAVIGGGCGGLAAAATAADMGLKVAVFEKQGQLAMGGNGPFAIESRLQRQNRISFTLEDAFEFYMQHSHYNVDAKLVKAYLSKSASTIDWFENLGIKFSGVMAYFPGAPFVWHFKDPESPRFTEVLAAEAESHGTAIHLETPARELIKENGRVAGLIAEDKAGSIVRVKAKAVVIGTGGFGENIEMVEKYTNFAGYPYLTRRDVPSLNGDGIRMAWEAGAAKSEMYMDTYRALAQRGGAGGTPNELGVFRQPILMVNQLGERFVNEEIVFDGAFAGNAVDAQKGRCAYGIFDEDTNRYYEEHEWDWLLGNMPTTRSEDIGGYIKKARDEGYEHLFMTDTIEELCSQTGIDSEGLRKTLDEYNKACDTGRDNLFFKNDRYLRPVRRPKFYAGRFCLSIYGGLGGVKINHKTEALTKDLDVIPGLYVVGNDSNTGLRGTYTFSMAGHLSGFAYNTGRIAGENASKYIKGTGK